MRWTLRDIAHKAGVSIVTVHKAIYDKPGISRKTRQRILEIIEDSGFSVNTVASSLKRDVLRIAIIYPVLEHKLNYFFSKVEEGVDEIEEELKDFRITIVRYKSDQTWQNQAAILTEIIENKDVDGVVIYCWDDTRLNGYFLELKKIGIPVITFNSDAVDSCRISCVTAPNQRIGKLAAEFMCQIVERNGRIIVFGGNRMMKNLREITLGFFSYMQKNQPELSLMEINDFGSIEDLTAEMEHTFTAIDNISGVYCNSARNSIPLCEALIRTGLAGKIKVITNDVFHDLYPYFKAGIITATIWQDPKTQTRKAVKVMSDYLTGKKSPPDTHTVGIGIVMKNNFHDYV